MYSSGEVQHFTGLTQRHLAYWDRTGLVKTSITLSEGNGSRRLYSRSDLVQLMLTKRLLDTGMSLQCVRERMHLLQQLAGVNLPLAEVVVVSDGRRIFAYRRSDVILDVLRGGQLTYFPVEEIVREVELVGSQQAVSGAV